MLILIDLYLTKNNYSDYLKGITAGKWIHIQIFRFLGDTFEISRYKIVYVFYNIYNIKIV